MRTALIILPLVISWAAAAVAVAMAVRARRREREALRSLRGLRDAADDLATAAARLSDQEGGSGSTPAS